MAHVVLLLASLASSLVWGEAGQLTDTSTRPVSVVALPTVNISSRSAVIQIERYQAEANTFFNLHSGVYTSGTTEVPLLLFVNLSTNTIQAYLSQSIWANYTETASAFRVYRSPVVTSSGTALSIFPGRAAPGIISKMQGYRSPTVSSNGEFVLSITASGNGPPAFYDLRGSRIFGPGTSFLVTVDNSAANSQSSVQFEWSEE